MSFKLVYATFLLVLLLLLSWITFRSFTTCLPRVTWRFHPPKPHTRFLWKSSQTTKLVCSPTLFVLTDTYYMLQEMYDDATRKLLMVELETHPNFIYLF
ncbi:hypothetical protein HanRHA438_Chr17g0807991 [Helianthus annuus]|nr:hypothetical protein HanRHA438_Chr17g0807991 [Helianthus annuus]